MPIKPLKLKWSQAARRDLRAIFRYIERSDPRAARAFVADLDAKARGLAASGLTGVSRESLSGNLRAFPYRDRCLYFRVFENQIIIVRVLHGKQDVAAEQFRD